MPACFQVTWTLCVVQYCELKSLYGEHMLTEKKTERTGGSTFYVTVLHCRVGRVMHDDVWINPSKQTHPLIALDKTSTETTHSMTCIFKP